MRLYYFTGPKFALENIRKQQLKVSFSSEVNDLYELAPFDFGTRELRRSWRAMIAEHARREGFISLSSHWSVPTMWAHYAEMHRGVCYGFDVTSPSLRQIIYSSKLQKFDSQALTDHAKARLHFNTACTTKSSHWEYEREWRIYLTLTEAQRKDRAAGALTFMPFNEVFKLRQIVIGCRSEITSADIQSALPKDTHVEVQTARASFRKFAIVGQQWKRLQK